MTLIADVYRVYPPIRVNCRRSISKVVASSARRVFENRLYETTPCRAGMYCRGRRPFASKRRKRNSRPRGRASRMSCDILLYVRTLFARGEGGEGGKGGRGNRYTGRMQHRNRRELTLVLISLPLSSPSTLRSIAPLS